MCPRIKKWAVFIHTLHIIRNGVCHFGISKKLMRKWCKLNTNTYYYYNKKIFRPCTTFYTHELVDNFTQGSQLFGYEINHYAKTLQFGILKYVSNIKVWRYPILLLVENPEFTLTEVDLSWSVLFWVLHIFEGKSYSVIDSLQFDILKYAWYLSPTQITSNYLL